MMNLQEATMGDLPEQKVREADPRRPMIWIALAAIATIFMAAALHGVIDVSIEKGNLFSATNITTMVVLLGFIGALIYAQWRWMKMVRNGSEPLTKRETLNRNYYLILGVLGALTGAGMIILLNPSKKLSLLDILIFNNTPVPLIFAIFFVVMWSIITPFITCLWYNRAIDEQEATAYRDGGNYAAHVYIFTVPAWWMLWRAEILPEPNGIVIFFIFSLIWSVVWLWKKYF